MRNTYNQLSLQSGQLLVQSQVSAGFVLIEMLRDFFISSLIRNRYTFSYQINLVGKRARCLGCLKSLTLASMAIACLLNGSRAARGTETNHLMPP